MKIMVVASNGRVGQLVVEEAVKRGHEGQALLALKIKLILKTLSKKI